MGKSLRILDFGAAMSDAESPSASSARIGGACHGVSRCHLVARASQWEDGMASSSFSTCSTAAEHQRFIITKTRSLHLLGAQQILLIAPLDYLPMSMPRFWFAALWTEAGRAGRRWTKAF